MPPKVRITKEDIIKSAVELVRRSGEQAINARVLAAELNCSTQPIFFNFATMDHLRDAVIAEAYGQYLSFLESERASGKYPPYKSYGMAYIRFASEEKQLFKLLFMRDTTGEKEFRSLDFEESARMVAQANQISIEKARLMHLEMWTCVHGIGVMLASSFLALDWELISNMLSDVYLGLRKKHVEEIE